MRWLGSAQPPAMTVLRMGRIRRTDCLLTISRLRFLGSPGDVAPFALLPPWPAVTVEELDLQAR
jgi:hypothetical protein